MEHPQLYASANHQTQKDNEEFLKDVSNNIIWSNKEKILDIGCGPGDLTANLLTKYVPENSTIVGTDVSEEMINYANATYARDRVKFKVMDVESLNIFESFTKNSFDKIYSFYCLQWAQDQRQAIENLYFLTRPGGEIFLIILGEYPTYAMYEILSQSQKWGSYMKDYRRFVSPYYKNLNAAKYLENLLKQQNFCNVDVKEEDKTSIYPSMSTISDLIISLNPFYNRIPESIRNEYCQDILNFIKSSNYFSTLPDGQVKVRYKLLKAIAKKR